MKKTSLKDIANKVGVSPALVSYVLNDKKTNRIRKEVAEKIRQVAKELNYSVNYIAKSLKTNRTYTIGLMVSDISNPFSSILARVIEDAAETQDYNVIFSSFDENPGKSQKLINVFLNRQVDGLIIAPAEHSEDQIRNLITRGTPLVLVDRFFPGIETNYVGIDNYRCSLQAIEHLLSNGYRKIGLLTFDTLLQNIQHRTEGYRAALEKAEITIEDHWVQKIPHQFNSAEIADAIEKMLAENDVEGILFASNRIGYAALTVLINRGIRIPDDLALITFDEIPGADFFYSPLTYIRQPIKEIGERSTQLLIDTINGNKRNESIILPAELVINKSSLPRINIE